MEDDRIAKCAKDQVPESKRPPGGMNLRYQDQLRHDNGDRKSHN